MSAISHPSNRLVNGLFNKIVIFFFCFKIDALAHRCILTIYLRELKLNEMKDERNIVLLVTVLMLLSLLFKGSVNS